MKHPSDNPKHAYNEEAQRELFENLYHLASMTECTGMMPTPAMTDEEVRSYSEIYDVPLTRERRDYHDKDGHPRA